MGARTAMTVGTMANCTHSGAPVSPVRHAMPTPTSPCATVRSNLAAGLLSAHQATNALVALRMMFMMDLLCLAFAYCNTDGGYEFILRTSS